MVDELRALEAEVYGEAELKLKRKAWGNSQK
jgi:hypothetical protein